MIKFEVIINKQTPKVNTEVDLKNQGELTLVKDFCGYAATLACVGLAANQVTSSTTGRISKRFFAMKEGNHMVGIINPIIKSVSGISSVMVEGCLTWPGRRVIAPRYHMIDVEYDEIIASYHSVREYPIETVRRSETLTGYAAQVFQHEMDHLNGKEEKFQHYAEKKVGRNEPCPCGATVNGKPVKYKKCCGK